MALRVAGLVGTKFLSYLGEGVSTPFLQQIRRAQTAAEFDRICAEFLDHDRPMTMEPAEHDVPELATAGR